MSTSFASDLSNLSSTVTNILNLPGYVPGLSTISGFAGRCKVLASVQVVTGIALTALSSVGAIHRDGSKEGMNLIGHGVYNIARGSLEIFPGLNLLTLLIDGIAYAKLGEFTAFKFFF